jgi:hypothetical protein
MEKPILFNTEMVKAIVEGRKTVTRRIIKNVNYKDFIGFVSCSIPKGDEGKAAFGKGSLEDIGNANIDEYVRLPYKVGDILYVRETWWEGDIIGSNDEIDERGVVLYAADGYIKENLDYETIKWRPSIHMPKKYSRIFLRVINVRAERLQDITTEEILKEGVIQRFPNVNDEYTPDVLRGGFIGLWNSTIKDSDYNNYSYKANPWVWVIEFERIEKGNK